MMPFHNPLALLGLLSIIPLIILYLIRPKPKEIKFSSIQFLEESVAERSAVLNRLITDPLFWIQLLVLASLSIAAAGPYSTTVGAPGNHLVVVMDVSASMESSFQRALDAVSPYLQGQDEISIILAESIPVSALQSGSEEEARGVLSRIGTRAVSADLSASMLLANSMLGSDGGNILVVSDFRSWSGDDPDSTRKGISSDEVGVVFLNVDTGGENVAIVGGWDVESAGYLNHTALIHNYGGPRSVPITVSGRGGTSTRTVSLGSGEDYYLTFNAFSGVTTVSLEVDDAVSADNVAYVYEPEQRPLKALYLGEPGPSMVALQSLPNVEVETSGDYDNFDLIAISRNASVNGELNRYINGGGRVVYVAYSPTESPQYLPVRMLAEADGSASLWIRSTEFAGDIDFEEIGIFGYLEASARRQAITIIEANGSPVLAYWRLGDGTVVYDGLEYSSDFYQRPSYPIFWYEMVRWLTGAPSASESNRKTGEVLALGEVVSAQTPLGTVTTSTLLLDEVGVYSYQGKALVANLYDPEESDLSKSTASYPQGEFMSSAGRESVVESELSPWVIALAALMVLLEMALIIRRREA